MDAFKDAAAQLLEELNEENLAVEARVEQKRAQYEALTKQHYEIFNEIVKLGVKLPRGSGAVTRLIEENDKLIAEFEKIVYAVPVEACAKDILLHDVTQEVFGVDEYTMKSNVEIEAEIEQLEKELEREIKDSQDIEKNITTVVRTELSVEEQENLEAIRLEIETLRLVESLMDKELAELSPKKPKPTTSNEEPTIENIDKTLAKPEEAVPIKEDPVIFKKPAPVKKARKISGKSKISAKENVDKLRAETSE